MLNFYLFKLSKLIYLNSIVQWFSTLILAILITLNSPTWAALQAELQEGAIKVTNDQALENVEAYLVWADIDAAEDKRFLSWQFDQQKWPSGLLPVFSQPIDLPAFKAYNIQFNQPNCPTDHGCFLALVITKPNQNPLDTQSWLDSVVFPLSTSASCERLPGQKSFLSCGENSNVNRTESFDETTGLDSADKTTAAPTAAVDGAQPAETEKPDIFKLVGNKILYANSAAQRFQVIDLSDLRNPKLMGKFALVGMPRELYVRDNFYILLQNDYSQPQGENTRLTVLRQEPDGNLTLLQDLTLSGYFSESRRRNEVIYAVTQQTTYVDCPTTETVPCNDTKEGAVCTTMPACVSYQTTVNITAFHWDENGQLSEVDKDSLPGYSPIIAIFPDYLVIANHNPEEQNWQTTQIQAFDLSQSGDSLVKSCLFKVPGQVPSEFHLNVADQYLQVVYGPENRETGSTLANYDLSTCSKEPVGQVGNIAPGENLFGTRFAQDRAFVITAVQKDPLWVIDISNPQEPKIMGELEVPGFSQKLFFHEDRLFAVGIDQPLPEQTDKWWSRVALSLFDVSNPTQPTLIKRVVPLADQVSYDYSSALNDERALLLDWEAEQVAALPIDSWETGAKSILQIVSLDNDNLTDVGYVDSPVSLQRAAVIDDNKLAALGDQILLTLSWGLPPVKPEVLGKLELATSLNWLKYQEGKLWAGVSGNNGYYRICRYNPTDLENPAKCLDLSKSYNNLAMDEQSIVAYDYSPLAIQALDTTNEQLGAAQVLETLETTETKPIDTDSSLLPVDGIVVMPYWYQRYALVHNKQFCIAEQRPVKTDSQQQENLSMQWLLRCWNLSNAQEVTARSIPGQPVQQNTFTTSGELVTREDMPNGQIRLNRVALEDDQAKLLFSQELSCYSSSNPLGNSEYIYMNCAEEQKYWPGPVFIDQPAVMVKEEGGEVTTVEPDVVVTAEDSTENTKEEVQPEPNPTTVILKLNPGQNFAEECRWTLTDNRELLAATTDTIVVGPSWGWWRYPTLMEPMVLDAKMMPIAPQEQKYEVYRVICGQEPQLLKQLETYPGTDAFALTPDGAWTAEGFAGIKKLW